MIRGRTTLLTQKNHWQSADNSVTYLENNVKAFWALWRKYATFDNVLIIVFWMTARENLAFAGIHYYHFVYLLDKTTRFSREQDFLKRKTVFCENEVSWCSGSSGVGEDSNCRHLTELESETHHWPPVWPGARGSLGSHIFERRG